MVVVKIELWPGGSESDAREIGRMEITNDGSGTEDIGSYSVALLHAGRYWGKPGYWRQGSSVKYMRLVSSPYHLVAACLARCGIR